MLEGLTKYWGFYLVAIPDPTEVVVRDLHAVLDEFPLHSEWVSDLGPVNVGKRAAQQAVNSQIVSGQLRKVLAARIVVFRVFLQLVIEVDEKLEEKHKRIWLLFQLSDDAVPFSGKRHPFVRMMSYLRLASDEALDCKVGSPAAIGSCLSIRFLICVSPFDTALLFLSSIHFEFHVTCSLSSSSFDPLSFCYLFCLDIADSLFFHV